MTKVINLGYDTGCYLRIFVYQHGHLVYSMVRGDLTIYFIEFLDELTTDDWWTWDYEYEKQMEREKKYEEWIE